jgi:hypothetical protein
MLQKDSAFPRAKSVEIVVIIHRAFFQPSKIRWVRFFGVFLRPHWPPSYAVQRWGLRCYWDFSNLSAVRFVYRYVI